MTAEPSARLRQAREEAKYSSASAFANAHGITVSTYVSHENGARGLTVDAAKRYASLLNVTWQWLIDGQSKGVEKNSPSRVLTGKSLATEPELYGFAPLTRPDPRDVIPVLGATEGGEDGSFPFNGEAIAFVIRPPFLAGATNGYALFVAGHSMTPRYNPGETVYVHPTKPVTPGCHVVIQVRDPDDEAVPRAFLKLLVRRTAKTVILEQYNPKRTFEVPTQEVVSIHLVVGSSTS